MSSAVINRQSQVRKCLERDQRNGGYSDSFQKCPLLISRLTDRDYRYPTLKFSVLTWYKLNWSALLLIWYKWFYIWFDWLIISRRACKGYVYATVQQGSSHQSGLRRTGSLRNINKTILRKTGSLRNINKTILRKTGSQRNINKTILRKINKTLLFISLWYTVDW